MRLLTSSPTNFGGWRVASWSQFGGGFEESATPFRVGDEEGQFSGGIADRQWAAHETPGYRLATLLVAWDALWGHRARRGDSFD